MILSDNRNADATDADSAPLQVSVVVPAYRAEAVIGKALASVARQTLKPLEIIVVDDGSRDDTAKRACEFLQDTALPHIVVRLEKNSGPSHARNVGVSFARGEYVAFLDADDVWIPDKLALQTQLMNRHPEVTLCAGKVELFTPAGIRIGTLFRDLPSFQVDGWKQLLWNPFVHTSAVMVRRRDLGSRPFDRRLRVAEDRDLWIRLASNGTVALVQQVVARKLESPTSFMSSNRALIASDTRRMIDNHSRAMRDYLTWQERKAIYGSLHSQIGKGLGRQPGRYVKSLFHLSLAIAAGFNVFDNARYLILSAPGMRALRTVARRQPGVSGSTVDA